jgi:hypothetical protein
MSALSYMMLFAAAVTAAAQSTALPSSTMMAGTTHSSEMASSVAPTSAPPSSSTLSTATTTVPLSASTTVLQIFQAMPPDNPLSEELSGITAIAGSIIDANAVATTIEWECLPDATKCLNTKPVTITEGPSTFAKTVTAVAHEYGRAATVAVDDDCAISATSYATCIYTRSIEVGDQTTKTTATKTFGPDAVFYKPMTITAGISKLLRPESTQTPTAAAGRPGIGGAAAAAAAGAVVGFF